MTGVTGSVWLHVIPLALGFMHSWRFDIWQALQREA